MVTLPPPVPAEAGSADLSERARRIKLVLTDVDGVLTDAGVYYTADGEIMKRFSIRDGMGVERLRDAGIETGIITGERSGSVQKRAEKLSITELHLGIKYKESTFKAICAIRELEPDEIAYIGDDVNDLEVLTTVKEAGLTGAPFDATEEVKDVVHHVTNVPGGHGAFRAFADWILKLRTEGRA